MEEVMWKAVLAGTAAAVISSSSLVFAHQMSDRDGARWQPSAADMKAFTDARVAAFKAGLELTPEQEKNWPAVEAAIRDMAKARADRMAARANEQPPSDPVEGLHRRAERHGHTAPTEAGRRALQKAHGRVRSARCGPR